MSTDYLLAPGHPYRHAGDMDFSSRPLHVLYCASDPLAVPVLDRLCDVAWIDRVTVVSQPDRPQGRRRKLAPSPVKARAQERGLTVWTPEKIGSSDSVAWLEDVAPDVMAVFAYGQYLPQRILRIPPLGAVNLHPSLLPRWRGASPIQHTLLHGDPEAGVSIIGVAEEMDAGPIYAQQALAIQPEDDSETLGPRLVDRGGELMVEVLDQLRNGVDAPRPQAGAVTECGKLTREDGRLEWSRPAVELWQRVRAFQPWPGSFTTVPEWDGPLKVRSARVESLEHAAAPGTVLDLGDEGPLVACGQDALRLMRVQPPGKQAMAGEAFLRGARWSTGMQLGN